jgi:hypothetical protein
MYDEKTAPNFYGYFILLPNKTDTLEAKNTKDMRSMRV